MSIAASLSRRWPGVRVDRRLVAAGVATGVTFLLGAGLTHHALVRVLLLVAVAPVVLGLALVAPAALLLTLVTWLAALGLVRRLVDSTAGAVTGGLGDPLLLVAPMVLVVLAAVAVRRGALHDRTRLASAVLTLSILALLEAGNPLQGGLLVGVAGLLFMLVPMLAFWVGRTLVDDRTARRLLVAVVVLAMGAAAYGLFQQYAGLPAWDAAWVRTAGYTALHVGSGIRSFGTMSSSAEYATFLGIGLVVCMAALSRLAVAPAAVVAGGVLGFAMFEDASRGVVVLAVAAGALLWAARRGMRPGTALVVGGIGLVVLVVAVGHAAGSAAGASALVQHQVQGIGNPFNSADSTLPGHFSEMVNGLRAAITNPIGRGTGSVSIAATRFGGTAAGTEVDPSNMGVALGLAGLGAYLVVAFEGLRAAYRVAAMGRSWWTLAMLGVLVVTFLQWTNGAQYAVAWLPWLVLGWVDRRCATVQSTRASDAVVAAGASMRPAMRHPAGTSWPPTLVGRSAVVHEAEATGVGMEDRAGGATISAPPTTARQHGTDLKRTPADPAIPPPGHRLREEPANGKRREGEQAALTRQATWRQLQTFLGHRPVLTAALVGIAMASGICMSTVLAVLAEIATALLGHHHSVVVHVGPLAVAASLGELTAIGIGAMVVQVILQVALAYLPARIMADLQADLRKRLFAAFSQSSSAEQTGDEEGQFQELVTNQVSQVAQGTNHATGLVINGLMLVAMILAALVVSPTTTLVVIVAGVVVLMGLRPLNRVGRRRGHVMSETQYQYAEGVHQAVHLSEEARVFGVTDVQQRNVDRLTSAARDGLLAAQFTGRIAGTSFQSAVMLLVLGGIAALQALHVSNLASLGVVVLLLVRGSSYAQQAFGGLHWLRQLAPYADRVDDARRRYEQAAICRGSAELPAIPDLTFDRVSFAYVRDVPVLRDVSFAIHAGEVVGFAGPTGAGKSTIVQILLGLRVPDTGSYLVDGQLATDVSASAWAGMFAYLPQEPRLMRGTVADNIRFFRDLDDQAVERAARLAHIHDDVVAWPQGYDTIVGQRADAVSGGQRQRIGLARALAGSPKVLVLDEPTSALDNRSERLIHQSLQAARGRMTVVMVAHRLTTLDVCDRVIVVSGGTVEAIGAPGDLAADSDYFRAVTAIAGGPQ